MGRSTRAWLVLALAACGNATGLRVDGPPETIEAGFEPERDPEPDAALEPVPAPRPDAAIDCAAVKVSVERVAPKVMLLVDGSGSMQDNFYPPDSETTRWEAVHAALLDPDLGVVPAMQRLLQLGLAIYGSGRPRGAVASAKTCPFPVEVLPPALNQGEELDRRWPLVPPGTFTPTGEAIELLRRQFDAWRTHAAEPEVIILATDGNPNSCQPRQLEVPDYQPTIEAALRARAQGTKLYVISLGTDADRAHLQQIANIGAGRAPDAQPAAPLYYPENVRQLTATLHELLGNELSCEVLLDGGGVDPDQQCSGSVRLNGEAIPCEPQNGFRVKDPLHIELLGASCAQLRASPEVSLDVTFPCSALREYDAR